MSGQPPARGLAVLIAAIWLAGVPRVALGQDQQRGGTTALTPDRLALNVGCWWPVASIHAAGEAGGIQGTPIDFGSDFGLVNRAFPQIRLDARPAVKHDVSFAYVPIRYDASAALGHGITFAGVLFPAGVQTQGVVSWNAVRFGYAYSFIANAHISVGVVAAINRTDVKVRLQNPAATAATSASVRIVPAAGMVARMRATDRITVSAEASGFYVPDRPNQNYGGHYLDVETHGTWALNHRFGADLGFRLINLRHLGHEDSGTMTLGGVTLGLVIRR